MELSESLAARVVSGRMSHAPNIRCPLCDMNNSHIEQVFTRLGYDKHASEVYNGTLGVPGGGGRRSELVIVFAGECIHRWEFVIRQHTGTDYLLARILEDRPPDPPDNTVSFRPGRPKPPTPSPAPANVSVMKGGI